MKAIYILILFISTVSISQAQSIAAGYYHTLKVCPDGTVMAFGGNFTGQLGDGTNNNSNVPITISGLTGVIAVSAGDNFSMALTSDSTVWTWGNNGSGQLGIGSFESSITPLQVVDLTGVVSISAGGSHAIVAKGDGTLWTWGNNNSGQAGDGTIGTSSNIPSIVPESANYIKVAAGGNHNLALKNDGTVWAMGSGTTGVLGDGTNNSSFVPIQTNTLPGVTDIASGQNFGMVINSDSTVSAWGYGMSGQLGNGSNTIEYSPVIVNNLTGITNLAQGSFSLCGIARKADGTLWVWGNNEYGQLGTGDGSLVSINSPIQLVVPTGMVEIAAGNNHSAATKNDGTTWAWGANQAGQLGSGNNIYSDAPAEITEICGGVHTGLDEQQSTLISIYPNPTSGMILFQGLEELNGIEKIQIVSISGSIVFQSTDISSKIDVSSLERGIYIIQVSHHRGVETVRFVKE